MLALWEYQQLTIFKVMLYLSMPLSTVFPSSPGLGQIHQTVFSTRCSITTP